MNITCIGILLAGLICFSSCSTVGNIDDIQPYYKMEPDNVIYNSESAESVLRGVYNSWRTFNISTFRPYMSILAGTSVSKSGGLSGGSEFLTNSIQADNIAISNIYRNMYLTINSANNLIFLMERGDAKGMPERRVKEVIAESKLHRALAHFQILRHFGYFFDLGSPYGIVLRNTPFVGTEATSRASVQDSYTFILEDLNYAIANAATNSTPRYYVTQTTAKAIKAKVLLHMGNMVEAEQLAKEVIDEANDYGYKLENNFETIFRNSYESTEALFATYAEGSLETVVDLVSRTSYSEYTRRLADTLVGNENDGELNTGQGYDPRFNFMFNPAAAGPLGNGKYPYPSNGPGKHNTQMILRLGEIYLIHAEAAARNKNYEPARQSLQTLASRVGYPDDHTSKWNENELLLLIFKHKILELFSENGEDWFDYVRYYKAENIGLGDIKSTIRSQSQLVLPIPQSALAGNRALSPNPL